MKINELKHELNNVIGGFASNFELMNTGKGYLFVFYDAKQIARISETTSFSFEFYGDKLAKFIWFTDQRIDKVFEIIWEYAKTPLDERKDYERTKIKNEANKIISEVSNDEKGIKLTHDKKGMKINFISRKKLSLEIKKLTNTAKTPIRAHATDAGLDLFADEDMYIHPGQTVTIKTGLSMAIAPGYWGIIKGRSGLTSRTPLRINDGVIDSPYRGEVQISAECKYMDYIDGCCVISDGYQVKAGDKIAQLIILPCSLCEVVEVDELSDTERGQGGFGSTGG